MHFAALAYVGESVTDPLAYYDNNTAGTISLLEGDEDRGREAAGVQFHLRRLRRARDDADRRDDAAGADQPVRLVEVVRRAGAARLRRRRQGFRVRRLAIFQRGGRGGRRLAGRRPRPGDAPDSRAAAGRAWANARRSRCSAPIIPRPTARASATTSTSRTSARPISWR